MMKPMGEKLAMLLAKFPEMAKGLGAKAAGLGKDTAKGLATEGIPLFAALALSNKVTGGHDDSNPSEPVDDEDYKAYLERMKKHKHASDEGVY